MFKACWTNYGQKDFGWRHHCDVRLEPRGILKKDRDEKEHLDVP